MTLNTAKNIEMLILWTTGILILPFVLVFGLIELMYKFFKWVIDMRLVFCHRIGNKLMVYSNAVKSGKIKNPYCLRNYTALSAYKQLKDAKDTDLL